MDSKPLEAPCAQVTLRDEEEAFVERRRFMAVCWGPGDPATAIAMLDDAGQLVRGPA